MRLWEERQRREGKTVNHTMAKEAIAGLAVLSIQFKSLITGCFG
jgi:hypothetical protein